MKISRSTYGDVGDVWYIFFKVSDPKTQRISTILQLRSLESLWPLKLSSLTCIRAIQTRPLQADFGIGIGIDWKFLIIPLMVEMGIFQCYYSFLTATFYFVMLNNLVLHIKNILLGLTPCDG